MDSIAKNGPPSERSLARCVAREAALQKLYEAQLSATRRPGQVEVSGKKKKGFPFMIDSIKGKHSKLFSFYAADDTGVMPGQAHTLLQMIHDKGEIPNFVGIKYTDYNLMDFELCTQIGNGKYNMLYGRDEQLLAALALGADAGVSSTIQYAPSLRQVAARYAAGDTAGAEQAQQENAKLCSMFGQYESAAKNVQKSIMKMTGIDCGPSRLPKRDLSSNEYTELEAVLRADGLIDEFNDRSDKKVYDGLQQFLIKYM